MKILALDTSTNACSVALLLGKESVQRHEIAPREQSNLILAMIDELMASAELSLSALDAIAFGRGPGSFVGLRIAASVTQGIAFASELPVVAVSSLAALAQGAPFERLLAAFDARMGEVYWGAYCKNEQNIVVSQSPEVVCKPEKVICPQNPCPQNPCPQNQSPQNQSPQNQSPQNPPTTGWTGIGTGWHAYKKTLSNRLPEVVVPPGIMYPQAKDIAILGEHGFRLGEFMSATDVQPIYIRDQVVS